MCRRMPSRSASVWTPRGETSKVRIAAISSGGRRGDAERRGCRVGVSADQPLGALHVAAALQHLAQQQVDRHPADAAVGRGGEDVQTEGDATAVEADLGEDPGLGERGEPGPVRLDHGPDDQPVRHVGMPIPVLGQQRPVRAAGGADADHRALRSGRAGEDLGAGVDRHQPHRGHPRPLGDRLDLDGEVRGPVLQPRAQIAAEPVEVVRSEPVQLGEEPFVGIHVPPDRIAVIATEAESAIAGLGLGRRVARDHRLRSPRPSRPVNRTPCPSSPPRRA